MDWSLSKQLMIAKILLFLNVSKVYSIFSIVVV
jgi:hypothetical protein